jgi:hypothetical protein
MHTALHLALDLAPPRCEAQTSVKNDVSYLETAAAAPLASKTTGIDWVMVAPAGGAAGGDHRAPAGRIRFRAAVRATTGGGAPVCLVWSLPSGRRPRLGRTAAQCWTACDTGMIR